MIGKKFENWKKPGKIPVPTFHINSEEKEVLDTISNLKRHFKHLSFAGKKKFLHIWLNNLSYANQTTTILFSVQRLGLLDFDFNDRITIMHMLRTWNTLSSDSLNKNKGKIIDMRAWFDRKLIEALERIQDPNKLKMAIELQELISRSNRFSTNRPLVIKRLNEIINTMLRRDDQDGTVHNTRRKLL